MKAIRVRAYGDADVLRLEEVPEPEPGPGEARVKIEAAGVNFVDVYHRSGQYPSQLPLTPGFEAAGTVDAVGPQVTGLTPGARVAYASNPGSYSEYVVAPVSRLVPVPEQIPTPVAAAVMIQGMTAHFLCNDMYRFQPGDTVLVHAAAGGLGQLLTQLLKRRGLRVVGTTSTEYKAELAYQSGADEVINYSESDFASEIRRSTSGAGVAVVYDSVGQRTWRSSLECVRRRGLLVLCGQSSGPVPPVDPQLLRTQGSVGLVRPDLAHYIAERTELLGRSGEIFSLVAAGELRVRIDGTLPLARAADAHRRLQQRATTGKILLIP